MSECCLPWPVDPACLPSDWPQDPLLVERIVCMASEILRAASAYTVGLCRFTVRPCAPQKESPCEHPCGCDPLCMIRLGRGSVHAVESVQIDDEILDPVLYEWYPPGTLVLAQGMCFPRCQRIDLPLGQPGTWGITYLEGREPDALAARAVTAVAVGLMRECADQCRTPMRNLTSTTVEGESRNFDDGSFPVMDVPEAADWLAIVNPYGARRQALWIDPDQEPQWVTPCR